MTKKIVEFELKRSTRLTPLKGKSSVTIVTDGKVLITEPQPAPPRPKQKPMAETSCGKIQPSPHGQVVTQLIRLNATDFSKERLIREFFELIEGL